MMDTYNKPGSKPNRLHPLVAGAAISVMLASLTGVAAMAGLLPNSHSESKAAAEAAQPQPAQSATTKPAAVAKTPKAVGSDRLALKEEDQAPAPRQQQAASLSASQSGHRSPDYSQDMLRVAQPARACGNCGRVESVHAVQSQADPSGVGVVGGAVVGGLLGNQIGGGSGKTLATIAGAVGGGYAGNEVEKRTRTATSYQVRVRMENGQVRNFPYNNQPAWHQGDRVRVVDGYLQPDR
ncbi:glycine zipper 2TM domain-containing protein [Noviherbaspirillum sp. 1P10PC]